jgi:hypothetical protein
MQIIVNGINAYFSLLSIYKLRQAYRFHRYQTHTVILYKKNTTPSLNLKQDNTLRVLNGKGNVTKAVSLDNPVRLQAGNALGQTV